MRSADEWFEAYGESHQNPTNKLIHWICVPLIFTSLVAMLWELKLPLNLDGSLLSLPIVEWANAGVILIALAMIYYLMISPALAVGMLLVSATAIWGAIWVGTLSQDLMGLGQWQGGLAIFVLAWIGQFIGHKIEGKKPSFFEDLQFLMIGPLWLLGFVYRRLSIKY